MADLIDYRMEIVGGPYDGTPGMRWRDDGEHPPPEIVLLGICRGDGACNSFAARDCAQQKKKHPYFWLPDEPNRPPRVTVYELQDNFIEPQETASIKIVPGRAVYVIGGLLLPSGRGLDVELPEELVTVGGGDGDGGVYASEVVREIAREHGIELGGAR